MDTVNTSKSGKFYRLENNEVVQMARELRPSEQKVLLHLKTLAPFANNQVNLKIKDIAIALELHPRTVSRALKSLDSKGLIELEVVEFRHRIVPTAPSDNFSFSDGPECPLGGSKSPLGGSKSPLGGSKSPLGGHCDPDRASKPAPAGGSESPKISQISKTLKDSLSKQERQERAKRDQILRDFVAAQVESIPGVRNPRAYVKKCLADDREHWENLLDEHQNRRAVIRSSAAAVGPVEKVGPPDPMKDFAAYQAWIVNHLTLESDPTLALGM